MGARIRERLPLMLLRLLLLGRQLHLLRLGADFVGRGNRRPQRSWMPSERHDATSSARCCHKQCSIGGECCRIQLPGSGRRTSDEPRQSWMVWLPWKFCSYGFTMPDMSDAIAGRCRGERGIDSGYSPSCRCLRLLKISIAEQLAQADPASFMARVVAIEHSCVVGGGAVRSDFRSLEQWLIRCAHPRWSCEGKHRRCQSMSCRRTQPCIYDADRAAWSARPVCRQTRGR